MDLINLRSFCLAVSDPKVFDLGTVFTIFSYPKILAISSITSISSEVSGRKLGTVTSMSCLEALASNPMGSSISRISFLSRSVPKMLLTRETRTLIFSRVGISPCSSTNPGSRDTSGSSNSQNLLIAVSIISGSVPLSNRAEASLLNPSLLDVLAIAEGSHHAISSATVDVSSLISVELPPITPAIPIGTFEPSATTPSSVVNFLETPSRVTISSPSLAQRTLNSEFETLAKSKVWLG